MANPLRSLQSSSGSPVSTCIGSWVTPDMAVRLAKFCGNGAALWLRLQQAYDLRHAERALKKAIARIPTAKERAA